MKKAAFIFITFFVCFNGFTQIKKANKIKWYKDNEIANFDNSLLVSQLHSKLGGDSDIMNRFESYLNKPKDVEELKQ